jgi:hypothetical protein
LVWSFKKVSEIRLSICIATLNRGNFIGETLESIICQATDEVEIVVLDGASTDNTGDVIRHFQERFPRLRYFRLDAKGGVDRDFARAVSMAQGEYCWLFSDDDLMKPGAIQTVLAGISAGYPLIIANAEVRNADLSKVLQQQRLPFSADRVYRPEESARLLAETGEFLSFIGCVIIKREVWEAREKERYFGSLFIHVGVIFQSPLPGTSLAIANPLISIRYGTALWLGSYFEIGMFKWPLMIWSLAGYPDSAKRQVCRKEPWRRLRLLLFMRAQGGYNINAYRKWVEPLLESSWRRAVSKAIAYFPGGIANVLAVSFYSARNHQMILTDLANSPFYPFRPRKASPPAGKPEVADAGISSQRTVAADALSSLPLRKNDSHLL